MLVIGLTGGIASGKSMISNFLRELGAGVIDADKLARELVVSSSPAFQEIVDTFGPDIIQEDGELNRKKLGSIIFASGQERDKLNRILHPKIIDKTQEWIRYYKSKEQVPLIVVDAPLLIETGMTKLVDQVWVVSIPPEIQIERLRKRDNLSQFEAQQRLATQMSLPEKVPYADIIIDNSKSPEETTAYIKKLWRKVISIAQVR